MPTVDDWSKRARGPRKCAAGRPAVESLEDRTYFTFGLTTTTNSYTVDTGAGLVFSVARTTANSASVGDLTSAKLNGTQLEAPQSATGRYSHYESGLSSGTAVIATTDPNGNWIEIACKDSAGYGVTQYYIARKGYNNIYMANYSAGPDSPSPGEMRFIMYTNHSVLTNTPAPSNNTGSSGAIESSDVFGHSNGTTTSKYYGEYRAIDAQTYGLSGGGFGVFMNIGNRETSMGGPFFKDIDYQTTSSQSTELYNYMFSGHSQTENFRPGLKGPYALMFTTGTATPAAPDYSWIDTSGLGNSIAGYVGATGRGTLTGAATGVPATLQATVALSNAADQYWATPNATTGAYTITGILPGTYTETLYRGELAVGTKTVTITAGQTTSANIVDSYYTPAGPVFRIGTWDGTPLGFLNADKITTMHPTDGRMSPWAADSTGFTNFTVGTDSDSSWPMAEWHTETGSTQNGVTTYEDVKNRITFNLTAAQAATAQTLRIGLTRLDQGRPTISVNGGAWNSAVPSLSSEPAARGLTTGNWRGNNCLYTFNILSSALKAGTNTIDIYCTSGSAGAIYAGYQIYDAIDLVPTGSASAPSIASVTITPTGSIGANGTRTFTAVARDSGGNVLNANFDWSASAGTIDPNGNFVAPAATGTATISVTASLTKTAGYSSSSSSSSSIGSSNTKTASATVSVVGTGPVFVNLPAATPNPAYSLASALAALGNDDGGESNLTYTWSAVGTQPNTVNFSANGTNAAKNTTATFGGYGTYHLRVTIKDASGNTNTAPLTVVVQQYVARYLADETDGATLHDSSPAGNDATLSGSYGFVPGQAGGAVQFTGGYASLPAGIVSTLNDFTVATWVKPDTLDSTTTWERIFDFGTGTGAYMFLTPRAGTTNALRFAITTSGGGGEQQLNGPVLTAGAWAHVAVTLSGNTATLYVNGAAVATNPNVTIHPSALGNTGNNYIGKSQYPDPALLGSIDDFRLYGRALSAAEIQAIYNTPIPAAPASLTATAVTANQINLAWPAVSGATGYNVYRATTSGGPYDLIASSVTTNAYQDAGLSADPTSGTPYYYVVSAQNAGGEGAQSDEATATVGTTAPSVATPAGASPNPVNATSAGLSVLGADGAGESTLTYTWSASGPAPVTFSANGTNAAKNATATFTAAGTYSLTATITDAGGLSTTSSVLVPVGFGALDNSEDVGSPALAGSLAYNPSTGAYTVKGGGTDVWGTADQFRYSYSALSGDGQAVARVTSVTNTSSSAKSGVMFRDSAAADAAYAFAWVSPSNLVKFETRAADGAAAAYSASVQAPTGAVWVRLVRSGDAFAASYSADGSTWTPVGAVQTVTMTADALAGLAVTSHNAGAINTAAFDNVSVSAAPMLSGFQVNDGSAQRSMVTSLTLSFSQPVTLAAGALTLSLHPSVNGGGPVGTLPENGIAWSSSDGGLTYAVSFSGSSVVGSSLADGVYDLTAHASLITNPSGQRLSGGDQTFAFHRLFGDSDGNGAVNALDYARFKTAFGTSAGAPAYNAAFDSDANGAVNALDYAQFKKRFGTTFAYT